MKRGNKRSVDFGPLIEFINKARGECMSVTGEAVSIQEWVRWAVSEKLQRDSEEYRQWLAEKLEDERKAS